MSLDKDSLDSLKIDRSATTKSRAGIVIWTLVAALVAGGGTYVWYFSDRPIQVEVATAIVVPVTETGRTAVLDASGYVVARREATVSSKVTGKIADVLIEEGMAVEQNQIVARLDDQSIRPLLELAETQLAATRTDRTEIEVRLAEATRNLARVSELRAEELVSEADLDGAQAEVDALSARLNAIESAVSVARATVRVRMQDLDDLLVRAPFSGIIVSKDAQPGEMVSPVSAGGGFTRTGIAGIVDMDSREIEVDVNESYINRVSAGQRTEAILDAYPDWRIPSHVINIVPTADRQKATVRVRIGFDELDPRILPNMGIRVSFLESESDADSSGTRGSESSARAATRVPATAIVDDGATRFVWRVVGGKVERVAVVTGRERDGQIELLTGVGAGDIVVVRPDAELQAGRAVTIIDN